LLIFSFTLSWGAKPIDLDIHLSF
jgi:hypothetical protein